MTALAVGAARRCAGHSCATCGSTYRHVVCVRRPSCPLCSKKRRQKYNARRTEYGGETYDSAAEAAYAARLDAEKRAGVIAGWDRWREPVTLIVGPTRRERVTYKPDFVVSEAGGETWAVDVKGFMTREFRLKALLWAERCIDLVAELRVVDRNGNVIARFGGRRAA